MDVPELERAGLLKNDRSVYLALLEIGSATVSNLARKTGLHRSYVYDILDKLIDLGLVSFTIKNNKKFFNTENPEEIIQFIERKKEEIDKEKTEIAKILPQLIERQKTALERQETKVFIVK